MSAWQYKFKVYWLLLLKLLPFKNPRCVGELLLITVKSCFFHRLKIKEIVRENCYFVREMSWKCQGILNGLKCDNPAVSDPWTIPGGPSVCPWSFPGGGGGYPSLWSLVFSQGKVGRSVQYCLLFIHRIRKLVDLQSLGVVLSGALRCAEIWRC